MNFEICFQILSMLLADNVFKGISEELALTYKVSVKNTLLKVVREISFCNCDQSEFDSVTEKSSVLTPGGSLWFLCTHHHLQQCCGSFRLPEPWGTAVGFFSTGNYIQRLSKRIISQDGMFILWGCERRKEGKQFFCAVYCHPLKRFPWNENEPSARSAFPLHVALRCVSQSDIQTKHIC